jgi:hypothetical protein
MVVQLVASRYIDNANPAPTYHNTYSKIPPSISMHFATRAKIWRAARLYSEIALTPKLFGVGHVYIYISLLRMTDTMTSRSIDVSTWDILYKINELIYA